MTEKIPSPFENFLGIYIIEKKEGACRVGLDYKKEVSNFHKDFHGGAIATLADTAAVQSLRTLTPQSPYLTVNIDMRFKNPTQAATIIAEAKSSHMKGKVFLTEVRVIDSDDKLIAEAQIKSFLPRWKGRNSLL